MTDHQHHGVGLRKTMLDRSARFMRRRSVYHVITSFFAPTNAPMVFHPERRTDGE